MTPKAINKMVRIGLIFPQKKLSQAGFDGIVERARSKGVDLVHIDLDIPLEQQGPFALIVHKLNETYLGFLAGDEASVQRWNRVQKFIMANPAVPFLDPLASIQPLYSRTEMATKLAQLDWLIQHGPFEKPEELAVQPIVPHGGVLFKAYTLAERTEVLLRPSLRNRWIDDGEPLVFDSQTIPKRFPSTNQTEIDIARRTPVETAFLSATNDDLAHAAAQLDSGNIKASINNLAARLSSVFGLTLFGFDVVLNSSDRQLNMSTSTIFHRFQAFHTIFRQRFQTRFSNIAAWN
ncbi:inositol 1, 3, 4-trisphosphate 5/6-kinase-domain-containing protein, partial [Catenaria anguillulae PL171]